MKIVILLLLISLQAQAQTSQLDAMLELPVLDVEYELAKDAQLTNKGRPLRVAVTTEIQDVHVLGNKSSGGQWNQLNDGSWVWKFEVHAENAKSLGFGLHDFYMPPTAELRFYDWSGELVKGPFNDQKNKPHKQLWPGPIIGDKVTVELTVSDKYKDYVSFSIRNINRGFRSIWQDVEVLPKNNQQRFWQDNNLANKSGSCNVDVVCDEGNDWRDQISSVARYTITRSGGTFLCTGQMINNTENDGKPLFLTANHCGFNSSNDATINIWWNYQSNQCRTPNSGSSGTPISTNGFNDTQSGSTYRASFSTSDFTLLELDDIPNPNYEVLYTGWDRRDIAPSSAVSIHHPSGHAKRISFENDATSLTSYLQSSAGIRSHIRIADWDVGTTEGGSSGSGLWTSDKLLVGQLHGGFAACGNNRDDWYGRLYTSWTGGGSSTNRLSNWLDPNDIGSETLQGLGNCSAMTVNISHTNDDNKIGLEQDFSVSINGGVGPYEYVWDVNADGETDGKDSSISAIYSHAFVNNVTVNIKDSEGCLGSATKAVVIEAPSIEVQNAGSIIQMCGNNDAFVDPGERWRIPVALQNNGLASANNAYAVFSKGTNSSTSNITTQDNYGNTMGSCDRQFIDISATGTELTLIDSNPSDPYPAEDEGSAKVTLSQPFSFYGKSISNISLSTNGFISTNIDDSGYDFDNDCPLPSIPNHGNNGATTEARIIPLHDDLLTPHLYHQHFTVCPRQSDLGNNLACDVFMYKDVDLYSTANVVESFNFEAILYASVNQWVYQYDGDGVNFSSSSVGIQNDGATDGASYSCNSNAIINTNQAVCVYNANNQLQEGSDTTAFHIETPVINLGDMQVSDQQNSAVDFSVAENAQCGSQFKIEMQAGVYSSGFNQENNEIMSTILGNNGSCNVVNNCAPNSSNDITPTNGLWYNPSRSGNGNDMYFKDDGLIFIQYTASPNRAPIWYITGSGHMQNDQANYELLKLSYNGPFQSSAQAIDVIGNTWTSLIDENHAIQTRTIYGEFSAELLEVLNFGGENTAEQRTGLWYNPDQSGWGKTIATQGNTQVNISYLYDNTGEPYWVIGNGSNNNSTTLNMDYFDVFCPHCPMVPMIGINAGTAKINYQSSNQSAVLENMQILIFNQNHNSQWGRSNLPLSILTESLD